MLLIRSRHLARALHSVSSIRLSWLVVVASLLTTSPVVADPPLPPSKQPQNVRLCLEKVYQVNLPVGFRPIGLAISEGVGPESLVTLWSDSALHVFSVSPTEPLVRLVSSVAPLSIEPLSAAVTKWGEESSEVQLFDVYGSIRTMDVATGTVTKSTDPLDPPFASGAIRDTTGWFRAHRIIDIVADTMGIAVMSMNQQLPPGYTIDSSSSMSNRRSIDRILHMRPGRSGSFLVSEAAFPFATIAFTYTGRELWRHHPDADQLRSLMEERDLRYVVATPSIELGDGVLSTFRALRADLRVAVVRSSRRAVARYTLLSSDLAFLAGMSEQQLLVATKYGEPRELLFYRWRWIDERQTCA